MSGVFLTRYGSDLIANSMPFPEPIKPWVARTMRFGDSKLAFSVLFAYTVRECYSMVYYNDFLRVHPKLLFKNICSSSDCDNYGPAYFGDFANDFAAFFSEGF